MKVDICLLRVGVRRGNGQKNCKDDEAQKAEVVIVVF